MRSKVYTTRVCLMNKCGSCVHAHYDSPRYACTITCDVMNPKNSVFQRTRHACRMYEFDRTEVCCCGETIEDWYNFCPTCGLTIKRRGKR